MNQSEFENRMENLKKLTEIYFQMEKGELIENYLEKLYISDILNTTHSPHPHINHAVFITRSFETFC